MSLKLFDLKGKTALVTGGTHGLGMAIATGLANAGAKIILINLEGTNKDNVGDIVLRGRATEILPMITDF